MRFFRELADSLSNFKAYGFFCRRGFGRTLAYLLLLSLGLGSLGFVGVWRTFSRDADDLAVWLKEKAPDFTLSKGMFATDPETMAVYQKEGELILVIGASRGFSDSLTASYARGIIIYGDRAVVTGGGGQKREMRFKDYPDMKVDKNEILATLDNRALLGLFTFVFWMIFYFTGKLFSALFLTGLGMNFRPLLRMTIPFGDIYKLAVHSLTLGMVLDALLAMLGIEFPYFFILYYLMSASYLWQGMRQVRDQDMSAAGLRG